MRELVIILLILFFLGAFGTAPTLWQHSANWGWGPSGGFGLVFLILLVLLLLGKL